MTVTKENERADVARAGLRARKPCVESSELPAVCYLYGGGGRALFPWGHYSNHKTWPMKTPNESSG